MTSPFEFLPTALLTPLYPRPNHRRQPQQSQSVEKRTPIGVNLVAKEQQENQETDYESYYEEPRENPKMSLISRELNEQSRDAILNFIDLQASRGVKSTSTKTAMTGGSGSDRRAAASSTSTNGGSNTRRLKESFYTGPDASALKKKQSEEKNLFERVSSLMSLSNLMKRTEISKALLMQNNITIRALIEDCHVRISDLKTAGVLKDFDDLMTLGFVLADLTRDRSLFNASALTQLYGVGYNELRERGLFSVSDLIACDFYPNELLSLQFDFDRMIRHRRISKQQLAALRYELSDLRALGLRAEHLIALKIERPEAHKLFRWNMKEYEEFRLRSF